MSRKIIPKDRWMTPPDLIRQVSEIMGSDPWIDLACSEENALAASWVGEHEAVILGDRMTLDEGLLSLDPREIAERAAGWAFMNPPYSRGNLPVFAKKAIEASAYFPVFMLIPFVPCDKWWGEVLDQSTAYEGVLLPRRRVNFVPPEGVKPSSQPSQHCIVVLDNRKPSGAIVSVPYMLRLEEVYD